jgi:hypothetical protein
MFNIWMKKKYKIIHKLKIYWQTYTRVPHRYISNHSPFHKDKSEMWPFLQTSH